MSKRDELVSSTLIIIPTYNEIESLPLILKRIRDTLPNVHILIVDDSSPDGTGQWVDNHILLDPLLHVMHRAAKSGLAGAYLQGFGWGIGHGFDFLVEMDADGSHRPEQLTRLLGRIYAPDAPDLVIGSRWTQGGCVNGWSLKRELLSRAGNLYIRSMLGMGVRDATAGFRAYRSTSLVRMDLLNSVQSAGFSFQVEMTYAASKKNAFIVEVPITFDERRFGDSKLEGNIFTEELRLVTAQGFKRLFQKNNS